MEFPHFFSPTLSRLRREGYQSKIHTDCPFLYGQSWEFPLVIQHLSLLRFHVFNIADIKPGGSPLIVDIHVIKLEV